MEPSDLLPDLGAAGQPAPVRADKADQPVALVDRHQPVAARALRAVDEQRLDVGRHRAQNRVGLLERRPRVELEQRLGRAHRARVVGHDAALGAVVEEERHLDGQAQLRPRDVVHREVGDRQPPVGHQAVDGPGTPAGGRTGSSRPGTRTAARGCAGPAGGGARGAIGALHSSQRSSAASRSVAWRWASRRSREEPSGLVVTATTPAPPAPPSRGRRRRPAAARARGARPRRRGSAPPGERRSARRSPRRSAPRRPGGRRPATARTPGTSGR